MSPNGGSLEHGLGARSDLRFRRAGWPTPSDLITPERIMNSFLRLARAAGAPDPRLKNLYERYAEGRISRRGFIRGAAAVGAAGLSVPAWMLAEPGRAVAAQGAPDAGQPMLDLAEWSYFFVGIERAELARATY